MRSRYMLEIAALTSRAHRRTQHLERRQPAHEPIERLRTHRTITYIATLMQRIRIPWVPRRLLALSRLKNAPQVIRLRARVLSFLQPAGGSHHLRPR